MRFLLDTHILLWWFADRRRLSAGQKRALAAAKAGQPLLVSDISLWEIAMLHSLSRIELDFPLREWLEMATAPPLVELCRITPAIAAEVARLPTDLAGDPADRLLVATARLRGATLVTKDRQIQKARVVETLA